ncbi:lanthionine synthetase LanC family protein [Chitinophaga solisilvae]|uniref:lanthionine synthetase LanC family protein n=1 Tax=Chitinophaga solisilvae TaxID=1233460 RepID=UPI00136ADCC4|nr:lanthionine synthetase LanC family protein [Chitinophaga solisilvae]
MSMTADHQRINDAVMSTAARLLQAAQEDEHGIYWITPPHIQGGAPGESTDLFNGTTGILFFFLSLYDYTGEAAYLRVCIRGTARLLQHPEIRQPAFYPFYTGATGILLLCIRMHRYTGNSDYLEQALLLTYSYQQGILQEVKKDDLLSGDAGNLLLFTHLYAYTQHPCYLEIMRQLIDQLLSHARIAPAGLKWDPVKQAYDSLTGFSHGGSGIAFALLQAARCLHSDGLLYLAEQALAYENTYADPARNNWMDLRTGVKRMQQLADTQGAAILKWELTPFLAGMSHLNTWAHGAAGIGIARLHIWEHTHHPAYMADIQQALRRCLADAAADNRGDYTLCSGYGGIAAFLVEAARILKQPYLTAAAQRIAIAAIDYSEKHHTYNSHLITDPEDPGLLSGLAGAGYFLLSTIHAPGPDSILHPAINTENTEINVNAYTLNEIKEKLFSRYYPRTWQTLTQDETIAGILLQARDIPGLRILLREQIIRHPDARSLFLNEDTATDLWLQHKGWLQHRECRRLQQQLIQQVTEHRLLVISRHVKVCGQVIWYSHDTGINSTSAGKLTAVILEWLATPMSMIQLQEQLMQTQPPGTPDAVAYNIITAQVNELLQCGFITPA